MTHVIVENKYSAGFELRWFGPVTCNYSRDLKTGLFIENKARVTLGHLGLLSNLELG